MGDFGEIAKAVEPLVDNLAKLTGPMCEEIGLYFGEKVRAFRYRNVTAIVEESVKRLETAGKPINPVPPRLLLPILDAASVEDNPTLQYMWSGLLASASDQADNMSPSYAETLKALAPIEARSMKVLYDCTLEDPRPTLGPEDTVKNTLIFGLGLIPGEAIAPVLILETLERLGLIRRQYDLYLTPTGAFGYPTDPNSNANDTVRYPVQPPEPLQELSYELVFTSYGVQFMRACEGPISTSQDDASPFDAPSPQ